MGQIFGEIVYKCEENDLKNNDLFGLNTEFI